MARETGTKVSVRSRRGTHGRRPCSHDRTVGSVDRSVRPQTANSCRLLFEMLIQLFPVIRLSSAQSLTMIRRVYIQILRTFNSRLSAAPGINQPRYLVINHSSSEHDVAVWMGRVVRRLRVRTPGKHHHRLPLRLACSPVSPVSRRPGVGLPLGIHDCQTKPPPRVRVSQPGSSTVAGRSEKHIDLSRSDHIPLALPQLPSGPGGLVHLGAAGGAEQTYMRRMYNAPRRLGMRASASTCISTYG